MNNKDKQNSIISQSKWSTTTIGIEPVPYNGTMYSFIDPSAVNYSVISLQSKREPYSQQELITQYGNLETRLGTNLGK